MKKAIIIIMALCVLTGGLAVYGCNEEVGESLVIVDVNPSAEFVTDKNDVVTQVNALNMDAEIALSGTDYEGMTAEQAIEAYIARLVELGYIDAEALESDPNAVLISVINQFQRRANQLRIKLLKKIDNYMLNNGIYAIVLGDTDMDALVEEARELGISAAKLRLIKSIQTVDADFTVEEGKDMSINALLVLVKDKQPLQAAITELETRKAELQAIPEEERTEEEQAELIALEITLADINALKEKILADKEALIERFKEKFQRFQSEKPVRAARLKARWELFKSKHPDIAQRWMKIFN